VNGSDAPAGEPPIFETTVPKPERPVLIPGLGSYAMMNGAGELAYLRETRGAPIEWGGIYAQSVRLTGPWTTRVHVGGAKLELGRSTLASLTHGRGGLEAWHRVGAGTVRDEVRPTHEDYGICRTLELENPASDALPWALEVAFDPFLAPVLMEGVKPTHYRAERIAGAWVVRSFGFGLSLELSPSPARVLLDGLPWTGEGRESGAGTLTFRWSGTLAPGTRTPFNLRIVGGLSATALGPRKRFLRAEHRRSDFEARFRDWIATTPHLAFPDAPELERGYALARAALRSLYTAPDADLAGLVAGYPWYPALWGRDLAWMLPAVQWLGDADWVERSLRTIFRFQARSAIPVLGARPGELPMQVAPGPVFLYGTSDTTLYYPGLVRRFADHTGSSALGAELYPRLAEAIQWGVSKADGPNGFVRNGGEVATMKQETEIGRVRVGFDAVDTTIWDSTDRRDHAVDVQVLWIDALESIERIADGIGQPRPPGTDGRAERLRAAFPSRYAWTSENYLYDSLRSDGTPVLKLRPNALRAVRPGLLPPALAHGLVERAARDDLTTPWGLRTLSDRDPTYDPLAYHDGRVWTIATAWAAEAALWAGATALGVDYLRTNARRLIEEGGYASECYRGDRAEPFDACFLLGFSIAPFLSTLFDSLWGITPQMVHGSVDVRPRFPTGWGSASIRGLRLGAGTLDLDWTPGAVEGRWSGPGPLTITSGPGSVRVGPGTTERLALPDGGEA
jgi:glycogen debranching enzyme